MSDIDILADTQESYPRPEAKIAEPARTAKQIEIRKMRKTAKYRGLADKFRSSCAGAGKGRGAKCWLCGNDISYVLKFPHPASFSVDHSIPAEERPDLFYDTGLWRPAHFSCNSARGGQGEDLFGPGALGDPSEVW